jgi:hypothetical protein
MLGWRDCAKAPFPAPLLPGLTTAATIFSVASIGMAVGGGLYVVAIFACLLILVLLVVVGWLENLFSLKTRRMVFRVTTAIHGANVSLFYLVSLETQNQRADPSAKCSFRTRSAHVGSLLSTERPTGQLRTAMLTARF